MNKNLGLKDIIKIILAVSLTILLVMPAFIKSKYYLNILSILAGAILVIWLGIIRPLVKTRIKDYKIMLSIISPVFSLILIVSLLLFISLGHMIIFLIISIVTCFLDFFINLFILKKRKLNDIPLLLGLLLYLYIMMNK